MSHLPDQRSGRGAAAWRRLFLTRTCPVCGLPVVEGRGVYFAELGAVLHHGDCDDTAVALARDYRGSRRGRWRSRAAWRRLVDVVYHAARVAAQRSQQPG